MADLRGQELRDSYQNVVTRGTGATPIEDGNGAPYFYEEGTWTPEYRASSGSVTHQTQTGNYRKVGNICLLSFSIAAVRDTATGNINIGGLPFTFTGGSMSIGVQSDFNENMPNLVGQISNIVRLRKNATNASLERVNETDLSTSGTNVNQIFGTIIGII